MDQYCHCCQSCRGYLLDYLTAAYSEAETARQIREAGGAKYQTYRPSAEGDISFQDLTAQNPDVIGWIMIPDTEIDYPLVQGRNNEEYINLDAQGAFSLAGSLFLDARNAPDFSDPLSVIYGHNMTGNVMFGGLQQFSDQAYLEAHPSGTLYYGGAYYQLRFLFCFHANGHDGAVYRLPLAAEQLSAWLAHCAEYAESRAGDLPQSGRILLLSTCASGETDSRTLLAAEILPDGTPFAKPEVQQAQPFMRTLFDSVGGAMRPVWLLPAFLVLSVLTVLYQKKRRCRREKTEGNNEGQHAAE